jgi:hypothetical protein
MQMNWPFLVMGKSHKLLSYMNGSYCNVLEMSINRFLFSDVDKQG